MAATSALQTKMISCPNCGSSASRPFAAEEGVHVVRCNCGLVFNNPQIIKSEIKEIYTEGYFKSSFPALGYEDYAANKKDIQKSFRRRMKHLTRHARGKRLLDAGCATGFFLEVAAEHGFQPEGIDCSEWAAEYARKHTNFPVYTGLIDTYPWPAGTGYDVITFWDVIEQLPDPRKVFTKLHELLNEGGILALTVRDIDSFMAKRMKTKWIHFRPREKFVYFSRSTIGKFLESLGFKIEELTTQDAGKDCTFEILFKKLRHSSPAIGSAAENVFRALGLLDKTLYLNFQDSMLVIARKVK